MKKRTIRFCCGVMAAGLLICGIPSGGAERVTQNHLLWNVAAAAETAVTVSNENECEFPYKSRVMGTSEPLKPLKAPYMARNPVKWVFFRLKGQEIPLKI